MNRQSVSTGALKREMGLGSALILVIANMVGTGVFTTSGFIVGELGSAQSLLLCWLLGGAFALAGALCYAELGAMMPQAGGEYIYLRRTFGKLPAFLSGWISLIVGFSAPIAAAAIAFATYLLGGERQPWFTLHCMGHPVFSLSATTMLAIGVVVVLSLIHHHSVRLGRHVQNGLTAFKIGIILVFSVAGLCFGHGHSAHITNLLFSTSGPIFTGEFAVSLIFVSFAYSGWNAAAYLGGEIKQPGRNVPLALIFGTLTVIVMYLVLNVVYIYALPVETMQGKLNLGTLAATTLFGGAIGKATGLAIAFGLLSVISAMIMAGPRVYYAMACDGVFFRKICQINASGHSPSRSIQLQAGLAILMIVSATFETLLAYIGFTLALSSLLTVCGLVKLRFTAPDALRPYRTLGYPVTPLVFICGNVWIIVHSLSSQPMAGLCGLGTVLLGGLCFKLLNPGDSGMRPQAWKRISVEECSASGGNGLGGQGK